jgi:signal transduction histidine kinase
MHHTYDLSMLIKRFHFQKLLVLILTLFLSQTAYSQETGSALSVQVDKVKTCWLKCPNEAVKEGEKALQFLTSKPNLSQTEIDAFAILAKYFPRVFIERGDYLRATEILDAYISRQLEPSAPELNPSILANQGMAYVHMDKLIIAKQSYEMALEQFQELELKGPQGNILNNLASVSVQLGREAEAISYLRRAIPLIEEFSSQSNLATALDNLAKRLIVVKDFELAQEYIIRARALLESSQFARKIAQVEQSQIDLFIAQKQFDKAKLAIESNKNFVNEYQLRDLFAFALYQQGLIESELGNYSQAIPFFEDAITQSETIGYITNELNARYRLALTRYRLQDYDTAELLTTSLFADSKKFKRETLAEEASLLLARIYEAQKSYKPALETIQIYIERSQKRLEDAQAQELTQYRALLDIEEKQKQVSELGREKAKTELALAEKIKESQRNIIVFLIVAGTLLLGLVVIRNRRKLADLEAKNAKELVMRKNKMLSEVSHELRTPLTVIKLQIEELQYQVTSDPENTYAVVHDKISSLNSLIGDIFQLSKLDANELQLDWQKINIIEWLNRSIEASQPLFDTKQLRVNTTFRLPSDEMVECDPRRLEQVLSNLIENSCRYTDEGGQVVIKAWLDKEMLVLNVEDSSPGVKEENIPRIFERLYREEESRNRAYGGSGLGLSIVKAIASAHSGRVSARSSKLGGLSVRLKLPLCRQSAVSS